MKKPNEEAKYSFQKQKLIAQSKRERSSYQNEEWENKISGNGIRDEGH